MTAYPSEDLHGMGIDVSFADRGDRTSDSPTTAKTHVNRTMTKLDARDRAQLVIVAYETWVVPPRE